MKKTKNIKSFIREEDWKAIKKGLLISSLWLILWFSAWEVSWSYNNHSSSTWEAHHTSTHANHTSHSSY